MMIQFFTPNPKRDWGRGDSSCAHNQLIEPGCDRWVQGEFDALVRDAAYIRRGPVPRPAIENQPIRILKPDDGKVLVALRIITIG
jgi:hypothetical protein